MTTGWSGTNFDRPDFKRMLDDIESGNINMVIVKDLSRFGREYAQMGMYIEHYFEEKGVRFISVAENIDSKNGIDNHVLPIYQRHQYCHSHRHHPIQSKIHRINRQRK